MLIAMNELNRRVGQDHHNARLTDGEVELIRALADGGMRYADIAEKFEINRSTVGKICRYERRGQSVDHFKRVHVSPASADKVLA